MAQVILVLAVIGIFIAFIAALSFPAVTTLFYQFWQTACTYIGQGTGILWLFVPKSLAIALLEIVIAMEVIYRAILIFSWIYAKIKP